MNKPSTDEVTVSREAIRAFGRHYNYDVSYLEALMEASPGAFAAYAAAMPTGQYQKAAPTELLTIAKLVTGQVEDCGPCLELGVTMARESKVPESVIRGALRGGEGLSQEQLEVYRYARGVAENVDLDPELLPRLENRWGREVVAELAIAIVGTRMYPALKRALGYAKRCSLMPESWSPNVR
jgi:alkylhydroperoxidase family enzyme